MVASLFPGDVGPRDLEERLRFEMHLAGIAARFQNLPAEAFDEALTDTLRGLLDALDVDRAAIVLFTPATDGLPMTHAASRPGTPGMELVDLAPILPWYTQQVREGRTVLLRRVPEDLPPEAEAERSWVAQVGLKSHVTLPMEAGGEIQGAVGFGSDRSHREWTHDLVSRLEVLATVLASALYRRRASASLEAAEELNQTVLESLSSEVAVLDSEGRVIALNEAWRRSADRDVFPSLSLGDDCFAALERGSESGHLNAPAIVTGVRSVLSGALPRFETLCRHEDATPPRVYLVTATPLGRRSGGAVMVHTDVTELEEAKAALERSLEEVHALKERLEAENVFLGEQVRHAQGFEDIVGTSDTLARVLAQVEQVAPTDAHVLVLGETGTGKDVIARALHQRSRRRERPLVTVNCAALPAALIESELFGYEKGAFTGALQRTVGRFEVAHGGSILLDEVGEMPLEVQAKLLRVLQTGEFERLGSPKTIKVDVRILAATNRDLEAEVKAGRFRADLYYRLSVFPITLPPLRERREDIPLLVWHFISHNQGRLGRAVERVPERLMRAFTAYSWPGNVRELENVVERALIMTRGSKLAGDPRFLKEAPPTPARPDASLAEAERAHIRAVLEECGWKLSGRGNAAERLGLNRSTLQFRMKKLGITRPGRGARTHSGDSHE